MKAWLTIREASLVVGRHERNIYRWIEKGRLESRVNGEGITEVRAVDAARVESVTKRGRPKGKVSER